MARLKMALIALVVVLGAGVPAARAGLFCNDAHCDHCECHNWRYVKYGGRHCGYCSPYRGFFGSPYYGGFNGCKWNNRGWGYDGLGTCDHPSSRPCNTD